MESNPSKSLFASVFEARVMGVWFDGDAMIMFEKIGAVVERIVRASR